MVRTIDTFKLASSLKTVSAGRIAQEGINVRLTNEIPFVVSKIKIETEVEKFIAGNRAYNIPSRIIVGDYLTSSTTLLDWQTSQPVDFGSIADYSVKSLVPQSIEVNDPFNGQTRSYLYFDINWLESDLPAVLVNPDQYVMDVFVTLTLDMLP